MGRNHSHSYGNDVHLHEETTPLLEGERRLTAPNKTAEGLKRGRTAEACTTRKVIVLICCIILHLLSGGTGYALGVIYVELIRVFNSPRTDAALVQTVYMGLMTAGGLIFTRTIARFGTGPCVAIGSIVACAGFVVSSLAENVPMIIVFTGVIAGLGMCICYLCAFITVGWMFHSGAGAPLVLLTVGNGIGQIIFPYVYDSLITEYGWRGTFLMLGGIVLHCVPIGVLFYGSRRFFKIGTDAGSKTKGNIEMWFIVDIMVLRGYTRDVGSLMVSLAGVGNCLGRLGGGVLRYFAKFPAVFHWIYAVPLVAGCHALILLRSDYWSIVAAILIYGIFFGIIASLSPAVMFEVAGLARYPRAVAMMNLGNGIGNTIGGLIGGYIKDTTGSYDSMFIVAISAAGYILLSTLVIAYYMKQSRRHGYRQLETTLNVESDSQSCEILPKENLTQSFKKITIESSYNSVR